MHYAPYVVVRLSGDQFTSLYTLLDAYTTAGTFHRPDLWALILLEYRHTHCDRQLNAFFNRDKRKLYAVKFSQPVALALSQWMRCVVLDAWQQDVLRKIAQVLTDYGLIDPRQPPTSFTI